MSRCGDMAIRVSWAYGTPFCGKGRLYGVSDDTIWKSDGRLSIVTVALSVTIRPQFATQCLRRSNQQGVGYFGPKFPGVPLVVDPWCLGVQSEHPRLTNGEIILEDWNLFDHNPPTSQTDRQTDRVTDGQTTCDRKTALCTKVHRAVKTTTIRYDTIR